MTTTDAKDARLFACERKVTYRSLAKAKRAARRLSNANSKPGKKLEAYQCPFCSLYHFGHEIPSRKTYNHAVAALVLRLAG